MNQSIKLDTPCEIIDITPCNPLISKCLIKVCYVSDEPNRNKSIITKDVAIEMANSLPGSPIVGFYNQENSDFEEHNRQIIISDGKIKFEDTTRPYGFVDLDAKVWFQDYLDGNVVHTYLVTEGYLWTGQYPEAQRILEQGNNQSMELDNKTMKGSWAYDINTNTKFFIINEAIFSKLCILGDNMEPCFEGAQITKFSLDDDFNTKIYNLMKEVKQMKGENVIVEDNKVLEQEVPTVEEPIEEQPTTDFVAEENVTPAEETPATAPEEIPEKFKAEEDPVVEEIKPEENPEGEGETNKFSLEDFQNLQESYSNLETKFNELQAKFSALEEANAALVEFKEAKETEEKQAMIDSFYMLSDEDKKDVQEHISEYSMSEIEAKLAIICVHNKLDMSGKADDNISGTTFSLENVDDDSEDDVPALVSVLRKNRKKED